jgi:signal transduction histidine kinase
MVGQVSHTLFHHHHPDGRVYDHAECPTYLTLRDGVARRIEDECFFHRDGHAIPVEYVVTPARDADGAVQGAVICFRDISRRVADQAALAQSEERLRASQRLEAVGQLTGGLAHDFNNLLTVVLGNAELLEERLAGQPADQELARMILSAAQRGSGLTQRLLAFARRQALEARPVFVGELVHGMEKLVRRAIGDDIQLVVLAAADQGCVLADAAQLENALLNLCLNARDAMPEGGQLVLAVSEVHLAPPDIDPLSRSAPGDYVCLDVSDTGTGIPADILARVVEPFFTTKEPGKGTGLGLSMVYGLVKQSQGFLDIESGPGVGTHVRIHLPKHAGAAAPAGPDVDGSLPVGHERLLLVEDDPLVRRHAYLQLSALGYQVTVAESGAQALAVLQGPEAFDLLLTDVMMPGGMNGPQLAQAAQALRPGLHVLFSSGYSMDALSREGRLQEGVLLLAKPYTKAELAQRVRRALS